MIALIVSDAGWWHPIARGAILLWEEAMFGDGLAGGILGHPLSG